MNSIKQQYTLWLSTFSNAIVKTIYMCINNSQNACYMFGRIVSVYTFINKFDLYSGER